jgi:hypothetical protein
MLRSARKRKSESESTNIGIGSGAESESTNTAGVIDHARRAGGRIATIVAIVTATVDGQDLAHDHPIASTAAGEIVLNHRVGERIVATFATAIHTDDGIARRLENNLMMLKPIRARPIVSPLCKQRRHRSRSSGPSVFDNRKSRIERRRKSRRYKRTVDVASSRACAGKLPTWI